MKLIPRPVEYAVKEGRVGWNSLTQVTGDFPETSALAKELLAKKAAGRESRLHFTSDSRFAPEGYAIKSDKNVIQVLASSEAGAFYALMSLEQMGEDGEMDCCFVRDEPKYGYRSFQLDCSRHFWTVEKIKSILRLQASVKMNTFHWHLSDDQGWRAEIRKYPLLTEKGSIRKNTQIALVGYNAGKEPHDDEEYGRGMFYTQEDMKEVVAYAKKLHIQVIPEIDMPGHMVAAIACYPELSCTGEPTEVSTRWGVMDNICCCGKENIYNFAKDVIDELCEIFPAPYFHIGGDEVPKTRWKTCPKCQAKIKELGLKDENALQGYFNNEMAKYLRTKGKRMIGWNEVLDAADIMDKDVIAQWWVYRGSKTRELGWLEKGGNLILSMWGYVYMDHPYNVRPLSKTYKMTADKLGIKDKKGVIGVECPQWCEYIRTEEKFDFISFARIITVAEIAWTPDYRMDYKGFEERLEALRPFFESRGWYIPPQKVYRGKARDFKTLTYAGRWNAWRIDPYWEVKWTKKNFGEILKK